MMRVNVKLFGLSSQHIPGYDYARGIILEMEEGATYRDLMGLLQLPLGGVALYSVAGIIKMPDDAVGNGEEVNIIMPLAGG
jgi:hypothetical protein